jgi:DNA-binding transcriptional LysR family regulator
MVVLGSAIHEFCFSAHPVVLLKTSRTIANALHPDGWWTEWRGADGLQRPRTSNMITLNSAELVLPAVLDGVGIGIGRRPIIDPLLKDGKLLPLFRNRTIGKAACYLVRPRGSQSVVARVIEETKQGSQDEIQQQAELSWGAVRRRHEQESERGGEHDLRHQ